MSEISVEGRVAPEKIETEDLWPKTKLFTKLETNHQNVTIDKPFITGDPFKYGSHNVRKIIKRGKFHIRKLSKPKVQLHPFQKE